MVRSQIHLLRVILSCLTYDYYLAHVYRTRNFVFFVALCRPPLHHYDTSLHPPAGEISFFLRFPFIYLSRLFFLTFFLPGFEQYFGFLDGMRWSRFQLRVSSLERMYKYGPDTYIRGLPASLSSRFVADVRGASAMMILIFKCTT